jgi:nicotinamide phosphoribosyltransferase
MHIFAPHATDFYKTGHIFQYPIGTHRVYSNWTCRSDKWAKMLPDFDHKVVFFGAQGVNQWMFRDLWNRTFFSQPKQKVLDKYKRRMDSSLGLGAVPVDHFAALHDLGYLPLLIKALPEGSRVDIRVPMMTMMNTIDDFYWITNYIETPLSAELWKPCTNATIAYEYRRLIDKYVVEQETDSSFAQWQGHGFEARGMSGIHDAPSSAGHLLSFTGTDTITAIDYLEDYYCLNDPCFIGGSVPATEHSVMCMGGQECEIDTYTRLVTEVYPNGIVSIVSDTWDFWKVITEYTVTLRDKILARDGKVVFRPDSGDPVKIIVGDPYAPVGSPAYKGAVECLWEIFGGTTTPHGYRTVDGHVGLIYGDSISLERAQAIFAGLARKKFSEANVVLGIGSFTYQYNTRDTFGTAIKATWGVVNHVPRNMFKDPKTDDGVKKSACGLIRVEFEDDHYVMYDHQTEEQERHGLLKPIFCDGSILNYQTLTEIRARLKNGGRP